MILFMALKVFFVRDLRYMWDLQDQHWSCSAGIAVLEGLVVIVRKFRGLEVIEAFLPRRW